MRELSLEKILSFCRDLIKHLQLDLTADGHEKDGVVYINITGKDRGLLLSNTAAVLNNIEYLLNKVFPGNREEAPGIELDSDDYRKHRGLELRLLAQMASQKVQTSGKSLTLQPMVPRERRIVHLELAEVVGVESRSEGRGDDRSITIFPV